MRFVDVTIVNQYGEDGSKKTYSVHCVDEDESFSDLELISEGLSSALIESTSRYRSWIPRTFALMLDNVLAHAEAEGYAGELRKEIEKVLQSGPNA